jgi:hypothetical protein
MTDISSLLLPVVSSGVTAGVVTFVLNTRQQERATRRGKLEELTSILSRQMIALKNQLTYLQALVDGHMSPEELTANLEKDNEKDIPHDRIQALITIYFPALLPEVEHIARLEYALQQKARLTLDARAQLANTQAIFDARNQFFASVLAQAPSVNAPLWKIWQ